MQKGDISAYYYNEGSAHEKYTRATHRLLSRQ